MLLHELQVFRVPDELSDEQAVMIEPSAVALHAVLRHLPQPGENVLIVGAGTIGLLVLQVMRALVPQAKVSVLARYAFQVEQATRMGAEHIIYPQDTYQGVQQATGAKLYKGRLGNTMLLGGYDVIYDTIGTKRTLHDALRWTRAGGTVVIVGVSLHMMRIDLSPIWYQEVSLIGSMNHGTEQWPIGSQEHFSTFAISAELIGQGLIHPEKLITHRFALINFPEALSSASGQEHTRAIKVIFDYALMPASVVPNLRSSARQRRPVRIRTTAVDVQGAPHQQDQQDQQPLEPPAQQEPAREERDWESMDIPAISGMYDISDMPTGDTWSQSVQPYPSSPRPEESSSESTHEPEETIPQHLRALAGAVESPAHEYVEYEPAEAPASSTASDDPLTMEFDLSSSSPEDTASSAATPGEQPAMAYEQPLAMTEEPTVTVSRQREPQPILLPTPAQPAPGPETELAEAAQPDESPPRTGRTRVKPSTRKTTESSSATNPAPDTL